MKAFQYQQRCITTPRGANHYNEVKNDLVRAGLFDKIDVKTTNSVIDTVNDSVVTTVEYTFI